MGFVARVWGCQKLCTLFCDADTLDIGASCLTGTPKRQPF